MKEKCICARYRFYVGTRSLSGLSLHSFAIVPPRREFSSFFINYVTEADASMTNIEASRILAFGGMALFMIGRLSGSFTMKWMSPSRLLTWFALADVVCMALVVISVGTISLYALYLSFFFMSIMFPTIFALGLEGMGILYRKPLLILLWELAGFAPMLMGYIGADNMAIGFVIPLLAFLYILYFALSARVNDAFRAPAHLPVETQHSEQVKALFIL